MIKHSERGRQLGQDKCPVNAYFNTNCKLFNQVSDEAQDHALGLFLQITDIFDRFGEFIDKHGLYHTEPIFMLDSYKSRETNFQWIHLDGTMMNYTGHFPMGGSISGDWSYTAFSNNEIMGE